MAETFTIYSDSETEINIRKFPSDANKLFIWLPSEYGFQDIEYGFAESLQERGIELWMPEIIEARFLPVTESSLTRIPASDVSALINAAMMQTNKTVYIVTQGRGAIAALRGVNHWQQQKFDTRRFGGSVLLSPQFFVETPEPGMDAKLMPIVNKTNQALYIVQPEQSPWWWKLPTTLPALQQSGSDTYIHRLKGVRDRFYFRPDATQNEQKQAELLPKIIYNASALLDSYSKNRLASKFDTKKILITPTGKKERRLRAYQGNPVAPDLTLLDIFMQQHTLADYKGKVVLINFWASWCPPCVHEMPSMQRLYEIMPKDKFEILAVNMAEDPNVIQTFLNTKVKINFPVLLDSDGTVLRRWKVFAFPTSFIIDPSGNIHDALFGSISWDTKEIIGRLSMLLPEPSR
jgi:thiol-disulfide isomerase/thioredoxin